MSKSVFLSIIYIAFIVGVFARIKSMYQKGGATKIIGIILTMIILVLLSYSFFLTWSWSYYSGSKRDKTTENVADKKTIRP